MCFEINGLKYLNLTIWVFCQDSPIIHTTLIAVKTFFIVKTSFIIHKLTWIHINSHNFYTYILKCIFWGSNYFGVYGCWLVWLLLYVFMVADWLVWLLIWITILFSKIEPEKKNYFIKVFTTSKTFVILIIHIFNPFKRFIKSFCFVWKMRNDKWQMRNDNLKRTHNLIFSYFQDMNKS